MTALPRFAPRRALGRTNFLATALGIGDLADRSRPFDELVATLRRALDAGLNLIDTAPAYEKGLSEQLVGRALEGRRDGVFVVDKIDHLDHPVTRQLDESLGRLGLTSVDLMVFHNVSAVPAWNKLASRGGKLDELGESVRAAKVRFRGISSHHPDVLRAALSDKRIDAVMFPVGPFVAPRYVEEILPLARERNVGTIGFKTFGAGMLVGDTAGYGAPLAPEARPTGARLTVEQCVRYSLSLDPDVTLLGLSTPTEQDEALAAAAAFETPMTADELARTRALASEAVSGKGDLWWNPKPKGKAK